MEIIWRLYRQLEKNTKDFEQNGKATVMVNGKIYTLAFTDQHRLSTDNVNWLPLGSLREFYELPEYMLEEQLPKHMYTMYDKEVRLDIDDPMELEDQDLVTYIVEDLDKLLKHIG